MTVRSVRRCPEAALRRWVRWAGEREAGSVRPDQVAEWAQRAAAEARQRPNTRHGLGAQEAFVLAVRAAYAQGIGAGAVRDNPAAGVETPTRPSGRRTALSSVQLKQAYLAVVAGSRDPDLDGLVFQFLRGTACLRGGVLGLTTDDLAPATRTVHVVEKYGKERWQPVSAHLMGRLLRHAGASTCRCARVFHRSDGGHLTGRWFDGFGRRMQRLAWAGELGVTAHWLRHTTVTDVERLGRPGGGGLRRALRQQLRRDGPVHEGLPRRAQRRPRATLLRRTGSPPAEWEREWEQQYRQAS